MTSGKNFNLFSMAINVRVIKVGINFHRESFRMKVGFSDSQEYREPKKEENSYDQCTIYERQIEDTCIALFLKMSNCDLNY